MGGVTVQLRRLVGNWPPAAPADPVLVVVPPPWDGCLLAVGGLNVEGPRGNLCSGVGMKSFPMTVPSPEGRGGRVWGEGVSVRW